jgi:glycosidase
MTGFYANLIKMKKVNTALWNGEFGGKMDSIKTNKDNKVFAFYREKDENRVLVFLNLSKKNVAVKPDLQTLGGEYTEYFTGQKAVLPFADSLKMEPWGYKVFVR